MAKIKHPNIADTVDEVITSSIKKDLGHISVENKTIDNKTIQIKGRVCKNFASYSYLDLEHHPKLKQGAIEAIKNYGTYFPSSRPYLSLASDRYLEDLMEEIYGYPVLITPSTTLANLSLLPSLIEKDDLVIIDHHVHFTVQNPVQICKAAGSKLIILRHNRMDILEDYIKSNLNKYTKIWYLADGIYSMYGDTVPLDDINRLLDKYHNFHSFIDDAHGMSWSGKNGKGWVLSSTKLHEKMVMTLSLSKGFGSGGGVIVFPNKELKRRISVVGGSIVFSGPSAPSMIGAGIASAKIHLSPEIYKLQNKLKENIDYCNKLLAKTNLPLYTENETPIFFIGVGLLRVGQNITKKLMDSGYFVNLACFPAVPVRSTGLRFSITTNQKKHDILGLIETITELFPKVLEEENYSLEKIYRDFKGIIKPKFGSINKNLLKKTLLSETISVNYSYTIKNIDRKLWNSLLGDNGIFDYDGLLFLEETFKNNPDKRDNWKFHYFIITDNNNKPVLATFFTECIWKDDMLAPAEVSKKIEEKRKEDPYYLTSKTITMGAMVTEGKHLYIDKNSPYWKEAMDIMLEKVQEIKTKTKATQIVIRDFNKNDSIKDYLFGQGFINFTLPDTNIIEDLTWNNFDDFLKNLSKKSRKHFKDNVLKFKNLYTVEYKNNVSEEELKRIYNLYLNVQSSNLDLNLFALPFKFFKNSLNNSNFEFIILKINNEEQKSKNPLIIAAGICYKSKKNYIPMFAALDYQYLKTYSNYRQLLYRVIKRANKLKKEKILFGLTASFEKTRIGAIAKPQEAFIQIDDNYKLEKISNMV